MAGLIMAMIGVAVAFWMYFDATKHLIGKDPIKRSWWELSAGGWAAWGIMLWPLGLPIYLLCRSSLIEKAKQRPVAPGNKMRSLTILGIAGLALIAFNLGSTPSSGPSNSDSSPVDIEVATRHDTIGTEYNGDVAVGPGLAVSVDEVNITSKVDHVTLKNVIVNRGNCSVSQSFPVQLTFGQKISISMYGCNAIEVSASTDQGTWSASYQ